MCEVIKMFTSYHTPHMMWDTSTGKVGKISVELGNFFWEFRGQFPEEWPCRVSSPNFGYRGSNDTISPLTQEKPSVARSPRALRNP